MPHPSRSAPPCLASTGVSFWFVSCEQRAARGFPCPSGEIKLGAALRYAFSNMPPSGNSKSFLGANFQRPFVTPLPAASGPSPIPLAFSICGQGSVPVLAYGWGWALGTALCVRPEAEHVGSAMA